MKRLGTRLALLVKRCQRDTCGSLKQLEPEHLFIVTAEQVVHNAVILEHMLAFSHHIRLI